MLLHELVELFLGRPGAFATVLEQPVPLGQLGGLPAQFELLRLDRIVVALDAQERANRS